MLIHSGSKCVRWLLLLGILSALTFTAAAQDAEKTAEPGALWTFEEAQAQLKMYPKDVFLQYVALKLGQRGGIDATELLGLNERTQRQISAERRENVSRSRWDFFEGFGNVCDVGDRFRLQTAQRHR